MTGISATRNPKTVQFNDCDGDDAYEMIDADGFTVFKVDSRGVVKTRRGVERI
jgi:hypothetical protein